MPNYEKIVNIPQLKDEIQLAGLPAPSDIQMNDVVVMIIFIDPLSEEQVLALDSVVSAHTPDPAYVTIAARAAVNTLLNYLNNPNMTIANTARAVIVTNLAPKLPDGLVLTINAQIAAKI